jgi:hypothetical protein
MGRSPIAVRCTSEAELAVLERAVRKARCSDTKEPPDLAQAASLQVVGRCDCGCASVDFSHLPPGEIAELVADAVAESPSGEHLGVLVWANRGRYTGLEIVGYSDNPAPLPALETIRGWGPEET